MKKDTSLTHTGHANHFYWLSGLDPASLFFITVSTSFRLDKSDAQYVDVIHTNAGIQGTIRASGHTDFWPNGGSIQPGCPLSDVTKSKNLQNGDNHNYSLEIFLIFLRNLGGTFDFYRTNSWVNTHILSSLREENKCFLKVFYNFSVVLK